MKTISKELLTKEGERSYGIQITKFDNDIESERFVVPVFDARDGERVRKIIANQIKQSNQSKYTKPSFSVIGKSYQASHKK